MKKLSSSRTATFIHCSSHAGKLKDMSRSLLFAILLFAGIPLFILASSLAGPALAHPQVTPTAVHTLDLRVQASADDTSVRLLTQENLEDWVFLRLGSSETGYVNGLRFQAVGIPRGARILEAHLRLYKGSWHKAFPVRLIIQGEATGDAQDFRDAHPLASQRPRTGALVAWTLDSPPANLDWFESPDMAPVIQEIVNRPDWASDHALNVFLAAASGNELNHYLDVMSYDWAPQFAPTLMIRFEDSGVQPTATPTSTPTATPEPGRLAVEQALDLACNTQMQGDTRPWRNNVTLYHACQPYWHETGPEAVYRIYIPQDDTDLTVQLYPQVGEDLDLFLLTGAYPDDCLKGADASLTMPQLRAGTYYLAVDGYEGAAGTFALTTSCQVHLGSSLYLPWVWKESNQ